MQNLTPRTWLLVFLHTEVNMSEWKPYVVYPRNLQKRLRWQLRDWMQQAGLKSLLTKHRQRQLWTFTMSRLLSQSLRHPRMSKTGQWLYKCFWTPQILMCYMCHQIKNLRDWAGLALWIALREQQPWTDRRKYPLLCLAGALQAKNYHGSFAAQNRGISTLGKTWATHCKVDHIDTMQQWDSDAIARVFQSHKAVFKLDLPLAIERVRSWKIPEQLVF